MGGEREQNSYILGSIIRLRELTSLKVYVYKLLFRADKHIYNGLLYSREIRDQEMDFYL